MHEIPRLDPAIAAYYARNNEPNRLTTGVGRLEFLRTQEIVRRYLPAPACWASPPSQRSP